MQKGENRVLKSDITTTPVAHKVSALYFLHALAKARKCVVGAVLRNNKSPAAFFTALIIYFWARFCVSVRAHTHTRIYIFYARL